MGDEAKAGGRLTARGGGQRGIDIAVLVQPGVGKAQGFELFGEHPAQIKLAGRGGVGRAFRV